MLHQDGSCCISQIPNAGYRSRQFHAKCPVWHLLGRHFKKKYHGHYSVVERIQLLVFAACWQCYRYHASTLSPLTRFLSCIPSATEIAFTDLQKDFVDSASSEWWMNIMLMRWCWILALLIIPSTRPMPLWSQSFPQSWKERSESVVWGMDRYALKILWGISGVFSFKQF